MAENKVKQWTEAEKVRDLVATYKSVHLLT